MYQLYFAVFILILSWIIKSFLQWLGFRFLKKQLEKAFQKLKIKIQISKLHLRYLEGILIEKEGFFKIQIEYIGFSSKWINAACNKPLTLLVGPTTINILKCSLDEKKKKSSNSEHGSSSKLEEKILLSNMTAGLLKLFLQHIGIVCQNLSITSWLHNTSTVWSTEIKVQLESSPDKSVCIFVGFSNCNLTALRDESPVLFVSHTLAVRCFIPPYQPISGMRYKIDISKLNIDTNEDLIKHLLIEEQKLKKEKELENSEFIPVAHSEVFMQSDNVPPQEISSNQRKEQKIHSVLKLLPEMVKLSIENFKLVYRLVDKGPILETSNKEQELKIDCNCLVSWKRTGNSSYESSLDVLGFAVNGTNHCKLILLKEVYSKAKLQFAEGNEMKVDFSNKVDNCHVDFIYSEIMEWKAHFVSIIQTQPKEKKRVVPSVTEKIDEPSAPKPSKSFSSLPNLTVNLSFLNCSCDLYGTLEEAIATSLSTFYLGKFAISATHDMLEKETLRCDVEICDFYSYVNISDILPDTHSSLPCQLEDDQPACLPTSERHAWGRLFELGKLTLQCELQPNAINCKSTIVYISCEWSLAMGLALKYLVKMIFLPRRSNANGIQTGKKSEEKNGNPLNVDVEIESNNVNFFLLGDKEGGYNSLLLKMDEVRFASGTKQQEMAELNGMILSQLKELQQLKTGDTYYCCKSSVYEDNLLYSPKLSACVTTTSGIKVIDLSVSQTTLEWNTNFHMALYEQIKDTEVFVESVKELRDENTGAAIDKTTTADKPSMRNAFEVNVAFSDVTVHLKTDANHSFGVKSKIINVTLSPDEKKVECPDIKIYFDDKDLFMLQEIKIYQLAINDLVEQRSSLSLTNTTNNAWNVTIRSLFVCFPYKFDFAESLEKFQNVIKMLKLLHKKPKPAGYVESVLPDLIFNVNNISVEFNDDPFEVKLGDNYILLSDEIEEAIEREQKLEAKLNQIKSEKGTMLSGKKLDELRRNLKEKNAQIYIGRSKNMYADRPPRRILFLIHLKELKLSVFADESMNGQQNILSHMKRVDKDSLIPDDIQFTTLWCRMVTGRLKTLRMHIRDYPQPFICLESVSTIGMVMGSEACGVEGTTRKATIPLGSPWSDMVVTKNMPPLKFYHDLTLDMNSCQVAWGSNFEPAFGMISQSFDLLSKPSVDPSAALPFWDKIRLLLHGSLKANISVLNLLLSASTNPYNTTEMLEIDWTTVNLLWTNGEIAIDGDFDLLTRTASKYDDNQVVHFPALKMIIQMRWICEGDSNDHHDVYPTNPEYVEDEQDHDSYSLFRSRNLDLYIFFETSTSKNPKDHQPDEPFVFLFASTFRWFQNYQANILSHVSRPIKRGSLFNYTKPRKPPLGRHLKILNVEVKVPGLNLTYWASFQKELGFEVCLGEGCVSLVYQIHISPHTDIMLVRRNVANWIMRGLSCTFDNVQQFLLQQEDVTSKDDEEEMIRKHYLFSVNQVNYMRQSTTNEELFDHKILLQGFKGAWTASNRELAFKLFQAYSRMQTLKKVLSSEALKVTNEQSDAKRDNSLLQADSSTPKMYTTKNQSGQGIPLLQQLLSEQTSKFIAQSEEGETSDLEIKADDDDGVILQRNWHIELVNSQVLLNGTETKGSIILTSSNATILKMLHAPVIINREVVTKLNKVSWSGKFRSLQYFSAMQNVDELTVHSIPWLTDDVITVDVSGGQQENENELMFGRNIESTGGFVEVSLDGKTHQLQRVISRCECEFRYVNLGDELDPVAKEHGTSSTPGEDETQSKDKDIRTLLKLKHSKLELSTSPSQYSVIADICQNLIFYTEPKKKEEQERLENAKFKLQLSNTQDLKGNVSQLQTRVRNQLMLLRHYERKLFDYSRQKEGINEQTIQDSELLLQEIDEVLTDLQEQIEVTKEQLFSDVAELNILINAYKDVQESVSHTPSPVKGVTQILKKIDVTFDDMQWSLTQEDGQLGIATVYVKKFKYNQLTHKDSKAEHCYEVGHFVVKNLLPNEPYREALIPHEVNIRRHLDKSVMLRIYTCVAPAVAGIMVKEHFEVNVCPIAVRLTHKLVTNLESFFFPKQSSVTEAVLEIPEIQLASKEEGADTISKTSTTPSNVPPPRPPPPTRPPPPKGITAQPQSSNSSSVRVKTPANESSNSTSEGNVRASTRRKTTTENGSELTKSSSIKQKRPSNLTIPPPAGDNTNQSITTPNTPKSASLKRGTPNRERLSFSVVDRDVNLMKERAAKNQTFIYVKIPEVPVYFSYKGEKERTIVDANNFNLCLPTLEYHSRTWTWQDLFQALKKDYIQTLVPQILKEKFHLKSSGADTKPSLAKVDDTNKAKLLFGEKQASQKEKKSAKKMLFGKLMKPLKSSSSEKHNEQASSTSQDDIKQELIGKGVQPSSLEDAFNRLRDLGESDNQNL